MKRSWKKACIIIFISVLGASIQTTKSNAEGVELYGAGNRDLYGSNYWKTSNLREWANSDQSEVNYSNLPPKTPYVSSGYEKEKGFLNEFSEEEKDGIAVSEHRVYLSSDDANKVKDGGIYQIDANEYRGESVRFNLPSVDAFNDRFFQKVNDKVFLLNSYQIQQFVEKRGVSLIKELTPGAMLKHNRTTSTMSWWINAPSSNIGNDNMQFVSTSQNDIIGTTQPRTPMGFVPAISLKKETKMDGKTADSLQIGESISYGQFMNKKIRWRVINKASTGEPLLLSEYVLDIKSFDGTGDKFSLSESSVIHYDQADVSMNEFDHYSPFNGKADVTEPRMRVINDSKLFERSNESFTLDIEAIDNESGLEYVELPNGIRIGSNPSFQYTVSENKEYVFKAKDNAGNIKVFTVPVSNINPDSSVLIQSSANGWTNKDVIVSISASNNVGFKDKTYQFNSRDYTPYVFPNYTSYTGKRIRITGSYELVGSTAPLGSTMTGTGFYYRSTIKRGDDYFLNNKWSQPISSKLSDLQGSGVKEIDYVFTIPGDYFENLQAWSQIAVNSNIRDYTVRFNNLSYELLDNDDFKIDKIILPNGEDVYSAEYNDTLTKEGKYSYKVIDSRGKMTEKTIEVKIDKELPSISTSLRTTGWVTGEQWIDVVANDGLSGVKEMTLPNGQVVQGRSFSYRITQNGSYTFTATDNAGNRSSKTLVVTNFDEQPPAASIVFSQEDWTNRDIILKMTAIDNQSGVARVELPDGTRINGDKAEYRAVENGTYTFKAWDKMGQMQAFPVLVSKIDKGLPLIQIKNRTEKDNTVVNITVLDR